MERPDRITLPPFEGELITERDRLATYASDAGHVLRRLPLAALRPASVTDVQRMVRYCAEQQLPLAARGQAHTTDGQALVEGGVVLDMGSLNRIHSIAPDSADVDAGTTWTTLTDAALRQGRTPPVLTGYLGLSIGGTLSVGGISSSNRRGAQVDRVRRLQVVTGSGDVVWCSADEHQQLFLAVLAGLGQYGVILRAEVDLIEAPRFVRQYMIEYRDTGALFADLFTLLDRGELEDVYDSGIFAEDGQFVHRLTCAKMYDAEPPKDAFLLRGLRARTAPAVTDLGYREYVFRVDDLLKSMRAAGGWDGVQHPWFDVFLARETVQAFTAEVLATLRPEDVGADGFFLIFPQKSSHLTRPMLRVPESEWVFLFDLLTAAPGAESPPGFAERMRARNRQLYEVGAAQNATRYPIGSLDFTAQDWASHYGQSWPELERLKRQYDPAGILTPGPGIFAPSAEAEHPRSRIDHG